MADNGPALPQRGEIFSTAATQTAQRPDWKTSGIFSSHMVLQHGRPVTVHGWCAHPGAKVEGEWDGQTASGEVDENGCWSLVFPPHAPTFEPTVMTVRSEYGEDVFEDVLAGDVWLLGGQSNMDLTLERCLPDTPEIDATISGDHPFRLFRQSQGDAAAYAHANNVPSEDVIRPEEYRWRRPDREAALPFSGLGYYIARRLAPYVNVPLGFIMIAAGGAGLRELMPEDVARAYGHESGWNVPLAGYYNSLIHPFVGLQFRGQIFFQGESEGGGRDTALAYDKELAYLVADERKRFGIDFPFYNVQLASYRTEGADFFKYLQWVRMRQFQLRNVIPGYHLAVDRDLGSRPTDADWAHSPLKDALAARIAPQILANEYGVGDPAKAESPVPEKWELTDDGVIVSFQYANGGLKTADGGKAVRGFSVLFENVEGTLGEATEAEIIGENTVLLYVPKGKMPTKVQYAAFSLAGLDAANLTGGTDLPVPAFEI